MYVVLPGQNNAFFLLTYLKSYLFFRQLHLFHILRDAFSGVIYRVNLFSLFYDFITHSFSFLAFLTFSINFFSIYNGKDYVAAFEPPISSNVSNIQLDGHQIYGELNKTRWVNEGMSQLFNQQTQDCTNISCNLTKTFLFSI